MKKLIFIFLRYSGIPFLFRELVQRRKVSILMFHDIEQLSAQKYFSYLSKNYNLISLKDYLRSRQENLKLPTKSLIMTFDDGHKGNFKMLGEIKKYKIPLTIFLCSEIINTKRSYWFKFKNLAEPSAKYKKMPNKLRLEKLREIGFEQTKEYETRQAMNNIEIKEMAKYVDFQAHTRYHPCLDKCNEIEMSEEILESKKYLEEEYGFDIYAIAYPNGNYSDEVLELVKRGGYSMGLTTSFGFNDSKTNLFELKRISTNDATEMNEFIVRSSGVWGFLKMLKP